MLSGLSSLSKASLPSRGCYMQLPQIFSQELVAETCCLAHKNHDQAYNGVNAPLTICFSASEWTPKISIIKMPCGHSLFLKEELLFFSLRYLSRFMSVCKHSILPGRLGLLLRAERAPFSLLPIASETLASD